MFKGALLSVALKKRLDGATKPSAIAATASTSSASKPVGTPSRASRLIVRNLPWGISEADLRALFLPYGPLHAVHFPPPPSKGFAFVWFLSKVDAERAIAGANGKVVSAGLAERLVVAKQMRKKDARVAAKAALGRKDGKREEGGADEAKSDEDAAVHLDGTERVIAVDWALSKERWEEEKRKMDEDEDMEKAGSSSEGSSSDEEPEGSSSASDGELGLHEDSDGNSTDEDSEEDDDPQDQTPVKPLLPATDVGTTLFIRNLPYEATEDELRTL